MTRLIHEGKNVLSISVLDQINRSGVLADLPEMGVVQTENCTDQHFAYHSVGNKDKNLSWMLPNQLFQRSYGPRSYVIKAFTTGEPGQMR